MISIPFSGSKKYSYKYNIKPIVEAGGYDTAYEVFGGSCMLSVNLYNDGVVKHAVINDFDKLFDLYPKFLDYKDWIVKECEKHGIKRRRHKINRKTKREEIYVIENGKRRRLNDPKLSDEDSAFLQSLVAQVPKKYWKFLALGNNFVYSARGANREIYLKDFVYFQKYLDTDKQREYLSVVDKLERVSLDYRDFLEKFKTRYDSKSILIVDPPYCGTYQGQYKSQFTERQTIKLLETLRDLNTDFIFFNHDIDRVRRWLEIAGIEPFLIECTGSANNSANRNRLDVLVYVKAHIRS